MKQLSILEKALAYIEAHLDEPMGLQDVAREAGYSYYHMTRLFAAVLGEPAGSYISKRRLYNASRKLIFTDQRIIDIGLDCGFESSEAFSRAFKALFGVSPREYRKNGLDLVMKAKKELDAESLHHIAGNISLVPELKEIPEMEIAGIRGDTTLMDNRLSALWEQYFSTYAKDLKPDPPGGYCVCETIQSSYTENWDSRFTVMIGLPLWGYDCLPQDIVRKVISSGRYAIFTHRGSYFSLAKTYQYIYGTWAMSSREQLDDREDFEFYPKSASSYDDADNEVKIYIPIK